MKKIKRRVVLHGPSTLTVSLPSSWTKKFDVRKGDELNLLEHGKELRVGFKENISLGRKQINLGNLKRLGKTYLTSSYRQGYDEILINYNDPSHIEDIQKIIAREMIGFEIIKQDLNSCVVRDIVGHSKDEFDTALRRIWLLIIDLSNESFKAVKEDDSEKLKNIRFMDEAINKFANYCLRLLARRGHVDFRKTSLYCHLVKSLEEIADRYKDLCNFYVKSNEKADKDLLNVFSNINSHLSELSALFYKNNEEEMDALSEQSILVHGNISNSKNRMDVYLSSICKDVHDLIEISVEINL